MLTWPPALRQDEWVYTLSGRLLADLHRPSLVVKLTNTTPKPLATLLGFLVSPLPAHRAWVAVVVLAMAVLTAATFAYGRRVGGSLGALVAVAALALIPSLPPAMYGGEIDLVAAALLVLAVVSGARARVALMIVLGLLRPLTWPLTGIAVYLAAGGSRRRRAGLGVAGFAAPAVVWLASDAAVYGNALISYRANERINRGVPSQSLLVAGERVAWAVWHGGGSLLCVIGLLGLAVAASGRPWRNDPFPSCVFVGYLLVLLVTWMQLRYNGRYALPFVALLPLCAAHLASLVPTPRPFRASTMLAAVCATAIVVAWAVSMSVKREGMQRARTASHALDSVPAVEHAFACGPVGVDVGLGHSLSVVLELAAVTNHSIRDFRYPPPGLHGARTQILGPHAHNLPLHVSTLKRKGWASRPIPLGVMWISPRCQAG